MDNRYNVIVYKLSAEGLFLLIIFSFVYFFAEIILPGFFSSRVTLLIPLLALALASLAVGFFGKRLIEKSRESAPEQLSTKQTIAFGAVFAALAVWSLPNLAEWSSLVIALVAFPALTLIIVSVFKEEKNER